MIITKEYLLNNPKHIFVFGDNLLRKGKGGAAILRDLPNTYGFITKKAPNNRDESFYRVNEYREIFAAEMARLTEEISKHPDNTYLISKLGAGLANRYKIWENVIKPSIKPALFRFSNVVFLWEKDGS